MVPVPIRNKTPCCIPSGVASSLPPEWVPHLVQSSQLSLAAFSTSADRHVCTPSSPLHSSVQLRPNDASTKDDDDLCPLRCSLPSPSFGYPSTVGDSLSRCSTPVPHPTHFASDPVNSVLGRNGSQWLACPRTDQRTLCAFIATLLACLAWERLKVPDRPFLPPAPLVRVALGQAMAKARLVNWAAGWLAG